MSPHGRIFLMIPTWLIVVWPVSMGSTITQINPKSQIKPVGENATIFCEIRSSGQTFKLNWIKRQHSTETFLGSDSTLIELFRQTQRYKKTMAEEDDIVRYSLHFTDLTPEETGTYICSLDDGEEHYSSLVVENITAFKFAPNASVAERKPNTYCFNSKEKWSFNCTANSSMPIKMEVFLDQQDITDQFTVSKNESRTTGVEGLRSTSYRLTLHGPVTFDPQDKLHSKNLTCRLKTKSRETNSSTLFLRLTDPVIMCTNFTSGKSSVTIKCQIPSYQNVSANDIIWMITKNAERKNIESNGKPFTVTWDPLTGVTSLDIKNIADIKTGTFSIVTKTCGSTLKEFNVKTFINEGATSISTTPSYHWLLPLCSTVIYTRIGP